MILTVFRGAAAVLLAVAASVFPLAAAVSAPADDGSETPSQGEGSGVAARTSAVDDFGACLNAQKEGDLLLLVDESGSLRENDPSGARVDASSYLLSRLAAASAASGLSLEVAVAGFSADFTLMRDWTRLDDASLPAILSAVERFRERDDGIDTDYWNALENSRRALAGRSGDASSRRCQAIVWFSDGQLEIEPRLTEAQRRQNPNPKPYAENADLTTAAGASAAEEAARASLCREGGLADQIRSSEVALFGVGLAGGTTPPDFGLMRSIAAGTDSAETACGALTDPPPGEFYLASDIDGLLLAFDRITTPARPPVTGEGRVCQQDICPEGSHRFVLDASVGSVHVLATSDVEGLQVALVTPRGAEIPLAPSTVGLQQEATSGDVDVAFRWHSGKSLEVDLQQGSDPASWTGAWSLVFVDPDGGSEDAVSRTNIHIQGDISPAWLNQSEWSGQDGRMLHTGEVVDGVALGLVDGEGSRVDPGSLLGTIQYSAALLGAGGREVTVLDAVGADQVAEPVELDLRDVEPGAATLRLNLEVTTASTTDSQGARVPGTTLAPQRVDLPLVLAPPVNFPQVAPIVDFGTVEGVANVSRPLPVQGPGCVWVEGVDNLSLAAQPEEVGAVTVTTDSARSGETCLAVEAGETAELPLELVTQAAGNGAVNGVLSVMIAPLDEPERATTVDVRVTADLRRPLDPRNFWIAFLVAILLGPAIPLGLAYVFKYLTAKIPPRALFATQIPVTVTDDGQVLREGAPFALRDSDLVQLARLSPRGSRSILLGDVELRTTAGASPFGAGFVRVLAPGRVGASSSRSEPAGRRREARLPLAVHNTWVVLHDPTGPRDAATGLLLVGADAGPGRRAELAEDFVRRAPGVHAGLAAADGGGSGPSTTKTGGDDPFALGTADPSAPDSDPFGPGPAPSKGREWS